MSLPTLKLPPDLQAIFTHAGKMGELMCEVDWASTPLGPLENWPLTLRTAVGICLGSRQSLAIWWGKDHIQIHNEQSHHLMGDKPLGLGRPAAEVWSEIWPIVGPLAESVLSDGIATWRNDQLLILERQGYPEETYFTYSYSPIRDEWGEVKGIFITAIETTERVVAQRRRNTLRELTESNAQANSDAEVCELAARKLENNPEDIPFALIYMTTEDGQRARLYGKVGGLKDDSLFSLPEIRFDDKDVIWQLGATASREKPKHLTNLAPKLAEGWNEGSKVPVPDQALVLALNRSGQQMPVAFLVIGVSAQRPFDQTYRTFLKLVADEIGTAISDIQAYAADRQRVRQLTELANARMKIVQAQTEAEVAQDRLTRVEQAVARVSHSDLLAKTDLGEFYKELSRTVAELLGAGSAVFSNLDENKQTTTIHPSSYGIPETIPPDFITSSVRPGTLTHEIIYKGRIIRTKETSGKEYNPYREFMAMIPIRDFLAVPWQLSDRPLGALAVWNSKTGEGFSEEDAVVLKIIADVAALVRQLTEMRVELAEKGKQEVERLTTLEEAKTTLLNLASHELRGPLATIRGYIDLLATGSLIGKPELTEKAYSTLANRTQQMELLINQMLEVARLEDYRLVLEFKPVDLGEIVRAQVEQAKLSISPEHQIRYIQDCNVISVMGEPERLIQIISNLFDNAIKYSPEGGEITIRTCCDEQSAWMEVTDQGLGIALEDQEIIFQRFGRIVTAQNSHIDGTGLGLHLTRELARMHDGDIEFTSQEGVGSTFIFRIPLNKQG